MAGPLGYSRGREKAAYRAYFDSMPTYAVPPSRANRIYRSARFGRNVDLVLLDSRQYRADQPCGDQFKAPACKEINEPRTFLGRKQMNYVKTRLRTSPAAWKIIANQVMVMKTIYPGGDYIGFDAWQGYPRERHELLDYIRTRKIDDVVFITGDIHTFIAGDVRIGDNDAPVATEFVGGSISSQGLGEGGGGVVPGADPRNPNTPQSIIDLLRKSNPWVKNADFDHHGYGLVEASGSGLRCSFKRMASIKVRGRAALPDKPFTYRLARGQKSIM